MSEPLLVPLFPPERLSTWAWWRAHQRRYNVVLLSALAAAFFLHMVLLGVYEKQIMQLDGEPPEITIFSLFFLGILVAIVLWVANGCYLVAGPLLEKVVRPNDVELFRRCLFALGLSLSIAIPFFCPLMLVIRFG